MTATMPLSYSHAATTTTARAIDGDDGKDASLIPPNGEGQRNTPTGILIPTRPTRDLL